MHHRGINGSARASHVVLRRLNPDAYEVLGKSIFMGMRIYGYEYSPDPRSSDPMLSLSQVASSGFAHRILMHPQLQWN